VGGRCEVAKATYRDILERRARENAVDFIHGVGTALTPTAFFETFMVKSCRTIVDSGTRVDVNTGIVAASRLQAVTGSRVDIAEMVAKIPRRWPDVHEQRAWVCVRRPHRHRLDCHGSPFQQWAVRIT
jgi:hypothetical protein